MQRRDVVDPRIPRLLQGAVAVSLVVGIAFEASILVYLVAAALLVPLIQNRRESLRLEPQDESDTREPVHTAIVSPRFHNPSFEVTGNPLRQELVGNGAIPASPTVAACPPQTKRQYSEPVG